jgi:mono/diheme cytochrome c family protein
MKEQTIIKFLLIGMVAILSSCYYDIAENLYPATDCVTANMSYQANIAPILQFNCNVCHSAAVNSGNVNLEGYDQVLISVSNGRLLGSIKHASGFKNMPQNAPKLVACEIAKVEQWIKDGAPNN